VGTRPEDHAAGVGRHVVAENIDGLKIRPTSCGIRPTVAEKKVSFTLSRPANPTIELTSFAKGGTTNTLVRL
jgi:hypothetical protein